MRRICVSNKPRDGHRLRKDFAVVRNGWHKPARVDGQIFERAWRIEVDDDLLVGDFEFLKRNVCPMGPWTRIN